jgi:hypothetical protein
MCWTTPYTRRTHNNMCWTTPYTRRTHNNMCWTTPYTRRTHNNMRWTQLYVYTSMELLAVDKLLDNKNIPYNDNINRRLYTYAT